MCSVELGSGFCGVEPEGLKAPILPFLRARLTYQDHTAPVIEIYEQHLSVLATPSSQGRTALARIPPKLPPATGLRRPLTEARFPWKIWLSGAYHCSCKCGSQVRIIASCGNIMRNADSHLHPGPMHELESDFESHHWILGRPS